MDSRRWSLQLFRTCRRKKSEQRTEGEKEARREREREWGREKYAGKEIKRGETLLTPVWYKSCRARGGSWPVDIFGIKGVSQRCIIPREGPFAKRSIAHGYREQLLFLSNCNWINHVAGNNGVSTDADHHLCRFPPSSSNGLLMGLNPRPASIWRADWKLSSSSSFFFLLFDLPWVDGKKGNIPLVEYL